MNEEFDYKGFANQLRFQVRGIIPEEYSDRGIYIRDLVYKYSILAGERVSLEDCKDNELRSIFVQVIAEWVFHKTVDLIASGVPEDLHETVLNKLYSDLYDFELKNLKQTGKLEEFGRQILDGQIQAKPCRKRQETACDYCAFSHLCGFDPAVPGASYREQTRMSREEIWKEIEKEEQRREP